MEIFTGYGIEVKISGAWVDLTSDVLSDPPPHCTRGIQGNGIEDRVSDAGRFTFSLNNSAANSASLLGYYSPGHASALAGWDVSLPVRLWFEYDGWKVYKWYGYIEPDGIQVEPGTLGTRRVNVSCVDFMGIAARHKMNLLASITNASIQDALETIFNDMPIRPLEAEYYLLQFAQDFPLVFDVLGTETTALGEFQKIATGASDGVSTIGHGYIVSRGSLYTGDWLWVSHIFDDSITMPQITSLSDNLLLETGDDLLMETGDFLLLDMTQPASIETDNLRPGSEFGYGRHIVNHVTITSYPRRVDASATTVLWTLDDPVRIEAGETTTVRGAYNNPTGGQRINGTDFVNPLVSSTDYKANASEDGSGADMTSSLSVAAQFGSAEVELTLHNAHATTTLYVGGGTAGAFLQARGKGVYTEDTARRVTQDQTSINTHGKHSINIDSKYMDINNNFGVTLSYGEALVNTYKNPRVSAEKLVFTANRSAKDMVLFLFAEPRKCYTITEPMNALNGTDRFFLHSYEFTIIGGGIVDWSAMFKRQS